MSISAIIHFKIIHKGDTQSSTVINELQTFIERIQRLSYYNVEFKNDLNTFSIFYDRCEHVDTNHIKQSMNGLHSFDLEYIEYILDGTEDPITIELVKGTGDCINQMVKYYPWITIEDDSVPLEDLNE